MRSRNSGVDGYNCSSVRAAISTAVAGNGWSRRAPSVTISASTRWRNLKVSRPLAAASRVPLVLRQIPIWNGDLIEGFVDLALERAFVYREHKPSEVVALEALGQCFDEWMVL